MSEACGSRSELVFGAATMVCVTGKPGGMCSVVLISCTCKMCVGWGLGVF